MALRRTSERSAAAARANGAKSKGPTTPEGLQKARMASYKHGFYAKVATTEPLFDPAEVDDFRRRLRESIRPVGVEQNLLFEDYVDSLVARRELQVRQNLQLCAVAKTVARESPEGTPQDRINLKAVNRTIGYNTSGARLVRAASTQLTRTLRIHDGLMRLQNRAAAPSTAEKNSKI